MSSERKSPKICRKRQKCLDFGNSARVCSATRWLLLVTKFAIQPTFRCLSFRLKLGFPIRMDSHSLTGSALFFCWFPVKQKTIREFRPVWNNFPKSFYFGLAWYYTCSSSAKSRSDSNFCWLFLSFDFKTVFADTHYCFLDERKWINVIIGKCFSL